MELHQWCAEGRRREDGRGNVAGSCRWDRAHQHGRYTARGDSTVLRTDLRLNPPVRSGNSASLLDFEFLFDRLIVSMVRPLS
jgi:hypothetical protein